MLTDYQGMEMLDTGTFMPDAGAAMQGTAYIGLSTMRVCSIAGCIPRKNHSSL